MDTIEIVEVAPRNGAQSLFTVTPGGKRGEPIIVPPDALIRLLDVLVPMGEKHAIRLALHFHDTFGLAVDNARIGVWEYGIRIFDSSAGGVGGCPFAPGHAGNVATEALVEAFHADGLITGIDLAKLRAASDPIRPYFERARG